MSTERHDEAVRELEAQFSELASKFRRLMAESAKRVDPELLPGAYKIFTTIVNHGEVTSSELCEELVVDKGQLSRLVRELESLDLVQRQPDPRDRRSALITPTATGLSRLEAARSPHGNALSRAVSSWSAEQVRTLTELLRALAHGETPKI